MTITSISEDCRTGRKAEAAATGLGGGCMAAGVAAVVILVK